MTKKINTLSLAIGLSALALAILLLAFTFFTGLLGWDKLFAFTLFRYGFYGFIVLTIAILCLLIFFRKKIDAGAKRMLYLGLVICIGAHVITGNMIWKVANHPMIYDISTNVDAPLQFEAIAIRADNLNHIPEENNPVYAGLSAEQRLAKIQTQHYPDIASLRLASPADQVYYDVQALVKKRGWNIVDNDDGNYRIEAIDEVSLLRFEDIVVIQVTAQAGQSVVDMRSVSQLGLSDLGVNAKRVRNFLSDLEQMQE